MKPIKPSDIVEEAAGIKTERQKNPDPVIDLRDQVIAAAQELARVNKSGNPKQVSHWCGVFSNRAVELVKECLGRSVVEGVRQQNQKGQIIT